MDKHYVRKRTDKLSDHINKNDSPWWVASKKKLKASVKHKITRTFVSALEAIDSERDSGNIDIHTHARVRSKILTSANAQISLMMQEIEDRFNVEALNYHITMKVVGGF